MNNYYYVVYLRYVPIGDLEKIYQEYYNGTSPVSEATILECGSFMIVGRWYFDNDLDLLPL